jgi:hypothetical protein
LIRGSGQIQRIRQARILDQARATGGDIRALCGLFGLSVAGAHRYTATVDHPAIAQAPTGTGPGIPLPASCTWAASLAGASELQRITWPLTLPGDLEKRGSAQRSARDC